MLQTLNRPSISQAAETEKLPMRVALETFFPPTDDLLRFIKQLGVDDLLLWGTTFGAPRVAGQQVLPEPELNFKELVHLRRQIEDAGLRLFGIESFPVQYYDKVMLGLDGRDKQIEHFKNTIRNAGRAGIPLLGFNWMPTGVWRTSYSQPLRGGAKGTAFDHTEIENAPFTHGRDFSEDEFWDNYVYFAERVLPVAEDEGVKLAIHPNDPPVEKIGGVPCLFRSFANFKKAFELVPSPNIGLTFCLGSWTEMGEDVIEVIKYFGPQGKLYYVHFQSVRGSVPHFYETFIGDANYDAYEVLQTLQDVGFNGVMIPGHVPQIEGDTEWRTPLSAAHTPYTHPMGGHRARAYTVGYLQGMLAALAKQTSK